MSVNIPEHWSKISWEEKARENPLFAVMTTADVVDAPSDNFDEEQLVPFFAKGVRVFRKNIAPLLANLEGNPENFVVAEYGCGVGRILKPISEKGYQTIGIDISDTMLMHCRKLAPEVRQLYSLDAEGRSGASSESANLVFSFAVVKHIALLSNYVRAIDEMCRVLKPGGVLALNVNCEDFQHGDIESPARTENFESYSLHYRLDESKPYQHHEQDNWSGVYIGHHTLMELLADRRITVHQRYYQNMQKLRGIWYIGTKANGPTLSSP
jgi:SAM-dependent methyltransferase